jgi:hypothetical protein
MFYCGTVAGVRINYSIPLRIVCVLIAIVIYSTLEVTTAVDNKSHQTLINVA